MIGLLLGLAAGLVQLCALSRFTAMVTGGCFTKTMAMLGAFQFLFPMIFLPVCAFFLRDQIAWTGCGMAVVLIFGAVAKFIHAGQKKGRDGKGG